MNSLYGSDQSFSDLNSTADLSLISYSLFRSPWLKALRWIADRKGAARYPINEELAETWHADEVRSDGHFRLFAFYPDSLLIFSVSADLAEIEPDTVLPKLIHSD